MATKSYKFIRDTRRWETAAGYMAGDIVGFTDKQAVRWFKRNAIELVETKPDKKKTTKKKTTKKKVGH